MQYKVVSVLQTTHDPRILSDELIRLTGIKTHQAYPDVLRRIVAIVEINGKPTKLTFLSDHIEWSAWSIAECIVADGISRCFQGDQADFAIGRLFRL